MGRFIKPDEWQPGGQIVLEATARDVATSTESMSVIAGPGAGKTELLAQRALYLLQTGQCKPPQRILAISFKRDAAKNLKDRVTRRCSRDLAQRFDSYTFDAFAKSLVDRFLALTPAWCRPPRDYSVFFPTRDDWDDFLTTANPPEELGGAAASRALHREEIERWGPLPLEAGEPKDITQWAGMAFWQWSLSGRRPSLSFPMIGRLAHAILTHNADVLKALRLTYSYVFLDEFQDTTRPQYRLVRRAFGNSSAVLTAVGDTKQRIMTWAGAEAEAFTWFEEHFHAQRKRLQMNHRSNHRIVQIINDLISQIEPEAIQTTCARPDDPVPEPAAGFYTFPTNAAEAAWLAEFIADDIEEHAVDGLSPDDFAVLVRIKADKAETQLEQAFAARGLRIRNEARLLSGVAIQDLLADDFVALVLGIIRMALGHRGHEVYATVQEGVGGLLGIDFENPSETKRLDQAIRNVLQCVSAAVKQSPVETEMDALIDTIVEQLDESALRRMFRQFEDAAFFRNIRAGLATLMTEQAAADWKGLVDGVEGKGQVRLMTVHKSKGLEYHTVIFLGLHHNAFFGYQNNRAEETNSFFVALSRARERVFFTRSRESGQTAQIQGLVNLLSNADVPFEDVT